MTTLMIKDLSLTEDLSPEQLEKIHGGMLAEAKEQQRKQTEPYTACSIYGWGLCSPYPVGARTDDAR
jgi:hypothetical protein